VASVITAVYFQRRLQSTEENHAVYVIGDLHGDVHCARHWVNRTGLIGENNQWTDPTSSLVFLGDYVDKGPTSRQTLEFVKSLTDEFPDKVTAILGNHEIELLRDRDASRNAWGDGFGFFQLSFAAAHPAEYLNYLDSVKEEDELVVEALYNASLEVYSHGQHQQVFLAPHGDILQYVPPELRALVTERMSLYQKNYLNAFRSDTELGKWLEQRPILALKNGALFVHGGVSSQAARLLAKDGGMDRINKLFSQNSNEAKLNKFLDDTPEGRAIYEMVGYRGNHAKDACLNLANLLPEGATRLGVGHTPGWDVRIQCNGNFLALDSSLGRYFRNSGNEYCRGHIEQHSSNGRFKCRKMNDECHGQIIRLRNDVAEVIS
jgi:hypothetical protein